MTSFPKKHQRIAFLLFFIITVAILHASEVEENEILAAARKWIADNAVFKAELPNAVPEKAVQMADFEGKELPLWRVDLQPAGYLVMSADDTLPPVVAFNTNGAFDMPVEHPLSSMLNRQGAIFQEELDKPRTRGNELAAENKSRWNALLGRTRAESVTPSQIITTPMLETEWNQYAPYYYFCPSGSVYAEHAVTGCVAVATAQMLKYHEWPPAGKGTKSHTDDAGDVKGTLKADFSIPYNWHEMAASYDEKDERDYGASELSVARLLMEMGVLAGADYELESTSAPSYNIHTLMAQYLGYSSSATYGDTRNGMVGYIAQSTLYSRIRADMTAGRPAFVAFDGHIFIADGLGTMGGQDYYHFNYGWGGYQDGWYLLTDGEENTVIVAATTNIQPSPVPVFKPMSCEQSSSFTLSWDFPKRLAAEAFRLTKTTGTRASTVISDSISGTTRSYTLTGQSGTATYTLEAKVGGSWQAVSNGVTVTVKATPVAMLALTVDNDLKSLAGKQVTTTITANNSLTNLTVTSSRPDILPDSGISVTGSGISRTVKLTPASGAIGNMLLYITATDTAGNTVKQTVPLSVMADEPLVWHMSKAEAFEAAAASGKWVLMVAGRNTCPNTNYFRNTVCETSDIKAILLADYELWYVIVDNSSEYYAYSNGLGNTLPFIAIINPDNPNKRIRGHGGFMSIPDARIFFDAYTPNFSLSDDEPFVSGTTQMLEISTLKGGVDIRYRLDDMEPTISDTLYTAAIPLTSTTTVSARAFANGEPVSVTETKTFTFMEQVATPVINSPPGGYCFLPYKVTATCETPGATIRYRLDTYIPSESSPVLPADGVSITEYTPFVVVAFKDGMKESNYAFTYLDVVNDINGASAVVTGDVQVGSPSSSAAWFVQKGTYNSAPSALQSAAISPGESSIMVAKVNGPGKLTFQWRSSSDKKYYDYLYFSIDDTGQDINYGVNNWAQKEFTITGEGDHILVWEYYKYSSYSGSGGYAWVDDIVWTPLTADTLISISVDGAASVASGSTESYVCTATWGDGSTTTVTPTWSLSSTTYASVDNTGKVTNKNITATDQTVALNATYTHNGVTETTSKNITLARRTLVSIAVDGSDTIESGSSATYTCKATWSDGITTEVKPSWNLNPGTYANINTNGKVTNQNTTVNDQIVMLTASYTFYGVSKTATKNVTLKKRVLQSIDINGRETIYAGNTVTYSCVATWSDGTTTAVMPEWSLSSSQYASVDANGKVTHKNTTDEDQTVKLTATYTNDGVTKTASKTITLVERVLTYLAINGDDTISSGSTATYAGTATWSDGATTTVMPTWSLSNTTMASVDATGKVTNQNKTDSDYKVTLTATYTHDGITKTASKTITLAKRTLASIAINGNNTISSGGAENYTCTATWSDGATTTVTPIWSLSASEYASVDAKGKMTNKNTTETDQTVTLNASYEYGTITKTATKNITLSKRIPASVAIVGDGTIPSGSTFEYICMVTWSDETVSRITPDWSLSSTDYASVDVNGNVRNQNSTDNDQIVTLNASYSFSGVTKTASKTIVLAKRVLVSIDIDGGDTISVGGTVTYKCKAKWGDGGTTEVMPTWSLSNTDFASVDAAGKVTNRNTTAYDHAVTLTATYTHEGITKTASKSITLTRRTLVSINIDGNDMIPSGGAVAYTCMATWDDANTTTVTPAWTLSSTAYATIDTNGLLKNMNSTNTEQTVSLMASYTVGDVTKTAAKVITLSKRTLTAIAVNGDDIIPSGGIAAYICTATWNIGESTAVTPTWTLSSTYYASIGTDGKVTNKNTTDEDKIVELTASYTVGDVTKTAEKVITLAKRTLTDIVIDGDETITSGGVAIYTCTATWSYGDATVVTPMWTLANTAYASVDTTGKVTNQNATDNDQNVTLTASHTVGDVTKTATKVIKLSKRTLENVAIDGDTTIDSGEFANYTCTATWSYGNTTVVTPTWSLSQTSYASVDSNGKVSNKNTTGEDQTVLLTASYAVGDMTKTTTKVIKLIKRTLVELSIVGDGVIPSGDTATYICFATWSDGEQSNVTPTWSLSSTDYAVIEPDGKVINKNTTVEDKTLTLTANYTFGAETKTASKTIALTNRSLVSVSISGDDAILSGGVATYICTATWSDGTTSTATATWSFSATDYAVVDAMGKVTNKNTTNQDQTVSLNASYEAGNVTKTATKVITLEKRSLETIAIDGNATIASNGDATYTCSATWSYGDSIVVTPTWSLSPTPYASVDATGKVTNKNTTDNDQNVTLNASYTVGDVTKTATKVITLEKRTLADISIVGDDAVTTGGVANYSCTAAWSYGDSTVVTPTWNLSSTNYASIDATGKVTNKNATDNDQTVTLTASYTVGDVTQTAMKVITLSKRTLKTIAIDGEASIASGKDASYTCTATWSYGDSTVVTPAWGLSDNTYASVDTDGKVTNKNATDNDQTVMLTASYTVGNVTKTATKVITLSKRTLMEVVVNGDATIDSGESATYTCTATWSYGDSTVVTPTWSLSSADYASVDADGKVTNRNTTTTEQTVTLTASYMVGEIVKTAEKVITLKGMQQPCQTLELHPGWNLVTLTRQLVSNVDGVQNFLSLKPMMFDPENFCYVFCDNAADMKPGVGYWVFSKRKQTIELAQDVEQTVLQTELQAGWNLVGLLEESTWPSLNVEIWTWRNGLFKHVDKNDLRVGCTYWVLLY